MIVAQQPERLITKRELAQAWGVSTRSVDNWVANGQLKHVKLGKSLRFIPGDVAEFLEKRTIGRRASRL
jgi:excisionase family DNA binding protein